MASSDGMTTTTSATSSEGYPQGEEMVLEQKKRRRMQSNRESARRSRLRKQRHVEGLAEQAAALQAENARAAAALSLAARSRAAVEAENAVLRTQLLELSSRLGSLNDIILLRCQPPPLYVNQNYNSSHNNNNNSSNFLMSSNNNAWNSNYLGCMMNQQQYPIMASTDMLDYYY